MLNIFFFWKVSIYHVFNFKNYSQHLSHMYYNNLSTKTVLCVVATEPIRQFFTVWLTRAIAYVHIKHSVGSCLQVIIPSDSADKLPQVELYSLTVKLYKHQAPHQTPHQPVATTVAGVTGGIANLAMSELYLMSVFSIISMTGGRSHL